MRSRAGWACVASRLADQLTPRILPRQDKRRANQAECSELPVKPLMPISTPPLVGSRASTNSQRLRVREHSASIAMASEDSVSARSNWSSCTLSASYCCVSSPACLPIAIRLMCCSSGRVDVRYRRRVPPLPTLSYEAPATGELMFKQASSTPPCRLGAAHQGNSPARRYANEV